jgi:hypothetical protein
MTSQAVYFQIDILRPSRVHRSDLLGFGEKLNVFLGHLPTPVGGRASQPHPPWPKINRVD